MTLRWEQTGDPWETYIARGTKWRIVAQPGEGWRLFLGDEPHGRGSLDTMKAVAEARESNLPLMDLYVDACVECLRLREENHRLKDNADTVARWMARALAAERHVAVLQEKAELLGACACGYDNPDDVCLAHSQQAGDGLAAPPAAGVVTDTDCTS